MGVNGTFTRLNRSLQNIRILIAVTKRSLIVDFRYKFQIGVEAAWTAVNVIVFVLLGAAWQATSNTTGVPYTMVTFFIIATGFFTVFSGVMESTVTAISEENQLGTMGFLVTNSVSPIAIIIGRYISSTVRWFFILIIIVMPPLIIKGIIPSNMELFYGSIIVFVISWIFFLGFTLLLTSIALIFKRTTTFNRVGIYVVRFAGGAFVPLNSFDKSFVLFGKPLSNLLIWFPPAYGLEAIRWLFTVNSTSNINSNAGNVSKDGLVHKGFNTMFGTNTTNFTLSDPMVQKMFIIVFVFLIISLILVERLTTIARKWGTIEFY